eukprot:403332278
MNQSHRSLYPQYCQICQREFCTRDGRFYSSREGLVCGHVFCRLCWTAYLKQKVNEGYQCLTSKCPQYMCNIVVPHSQFEKFLKNEMEFKTYQKWYFKAYSDDNNNISWCPYQGCNKGVLFQDFRFSEIICKCGKKFCFKCGDESLKPCNCKSSELQIQEMSINPNFTWSFTHNYHCPECGISIVKDQGCNHMSCKMCGKEFCWLCMGKWSDHGQQGGFYNCNKYEELKMTDEQIFKEEQVRQSAINDLDRQIFYVKRFNSHYQAENHARQLKPVIRENTRLLHKIKKYSLDDLEFLNEAISEVIKCRRLLKYTYLYGYFLNSSTEQPYFQFLQGILERNCDYLHELIEKPLDIYLDTKITDSKDFYHFKGQLVNQFQITKNSNFNLRDGIKLSKKKDIQEFYSQIDRKSNFQLNCLNNDKVARFFNENLRQNIDDTKNLYQTLLSKDFDIHKLVIDIIESKFNDLFKVNLGDGRKCLEKLSEECDILFWAELFKLLSYLTEADQKFCSEIVRKLTQMGEIGEQIGKLLNYQAQGDIIKLYNNIVSFVQTTDKHLATLPLIENNIYQIIKNANEEARRFNRIKMKVVNEIQQNLIKLMNYLGQPAIYALSQIRCINQLTQSKEATRMNRLEKEVIALSMNKPSELNNYYGQITQKKQEIENLRVIIQKEKQIDVFNMEAERDAQVKNYFEQTSNLLSEMIKEINLCYIHFGDEMCEEIYEVLTLQSFEVERGDVLDKLTQLLKYQTIAVPKNINPRRTHSKIVIISENVASKVIKVFIQLLWNPKLEDFFKNVILQTIEKIYFEIDNGSYKDEFIKLGGGIILQQLQLHPMDIIANKAIFMMRDLLKGKEVDYLGKIDMINKSLFI